MWTPMAKNPTGRSSNTAFVLKLSCAIVCIKKSLIFSYGQWQGIWAKSQKIVYNLFCHFLFPYSINGRVKKVDMNTFRKHLWIWFLKRDSWNSLVGELKSHMLHGTAKTNKQINKLKGTHGLPGSQAIKILCFRCRDPGFNTWPGN